MKTISDSEYKILIVGNGFDIAHGLKTKYTDFLNFIKEIREKGYNYDGIDKVVADQIKENIENNHLIGYFIYLYDKKSSRDKWVDFEEEISNIVKYYDQKINSPNGYFKEYMKNHRNSIMPHNLLSLLNKLITAFDLYLDYVVRETDIEIFSPDIDDLKISNIISFNYTDTYMKVYDNEYRKNSFIPGTFQFVNSSVINSSETKDEISPIEIDFIHGATSQYNNGKENIVLGIDEYLSEEDVDKDLDYIKLKKYFQRIQKRTGCLYKKWIRDMQEESQNEIYFFGHSLAVSDKDILNELLTCSKIKKCTIFYYNEKDYEEKIINLVRIIGKDTLIEYTYTAEPKIEFRLQRDLIKRSDK